MILKDYFNKYKKTKALTIVGPLLKKPKHYKNPVVFVDRGSHFRKASEGFSVGDGDSSQKKLDQLLSTDKNYSDLSYVLSQIPKNFTKIHLLGFIGGRKDHELINLGEVFWFMKKQFKKNNRVEVFFDDVIIGSSVRKIRFKHIGIFSILSFEKLDLKISGKCKYVGKFKSVKPLDSHLLSNVGSGIIQIQVLNNKPVFVFKIKYD